MPLARRLDQATGHLWECGADSELWRSCEANHELELAGVILQHRIPTIMACGHDYTLACTCGVKVRGVSCPSWCIRSTTWHWGAQGCGRLFSSSTCSYRRGKRSSRGLFLSSVWTCPPNSDYFVWSTVSVLQSGL